MRMARQGRFAWRVDALAFTVLLAFGLALALPHAWGTVQWNPDALFYEAQIHELQGEGDHAALERVFASSLADREKAKERDEPPALQRIANPRWVDYSARFYRRRWTVPLLADAISPVGGVDSLEYVSLVGLALIAPLLYLLLRARFSVLTSAVAAAFCQVMPPLLAMAPHPNTDTWGLALLILALIVATRVAERGRRWLPLWVLVILALSFTRDATIVAVTAVAWLAWRERSRLMLATTLTGIAASLPAPILFSAPLRQQLAYALDDYRIPPHTSWSWILAKYPGAIGSVIKLDFRYPLETAVPALTVLMGVIALVGVVTLLAGERHRARGPLPALASGSLVGAVVTVLVAANYTAMRLELVFLPAVAVGVALLFDGVRDVVAERRLPTAPRAAPAGG